MTPELKLNVSAGQGGFLVSGVDLRARTVKLRPMRLRLKEIRSRKNLGQAEIAERLGKSVTQISRYETGVDGVSTKQLSDVAAAYGVTVPELFEPEEVPVVGRVGAGAEVLYIDNYPLGVAASTVPRPPGLKGEMVAVQVVGDSMQDRYFEGDLLFYNSESEAADADVVGRYCVVNVDDGRMLVKKVLRGKKFGTWRLESPNAPPIVDVHLRWAAPVRAVVTPPRSPEKP